MTSLSIVADHLSPTKNRRLKSLARRPATLLKMRLWHRCFPVNFAKFANTFSYRTLPVAASGRL